MSETYKILVVEDNDFVRMQITRFLKDDGFETLEGSDGQDALNKISNDVNLAIVDVRMEPLDGFDFVKTLRSNNIQTPVILVTGDQNPELLSNASKLGVVAVLMKPVQKDRLLKTVQRALKIRAKAS